MPTALNRSAARQSPLVAYLDLTYLNFTSAVDAPAIQVPAGAVVVGGSLVVDTAWNSGSGDTLSVGDPLVFNRYLNAFTLAAAGRSVLTITDYIYLVPTLISVRWTGAGAAPSAGAARLHIDYYRRGKADTAEGLDQGQGGRLA